MSTLRVLCQEEIWRLQQQLGVLPNIPSAMMGWDSRPWKETPFFWSDNTPEKFRELCVRAKRVLDSTSGSAPERNKLVFCCWNEFGEGHYIEPTRGYGYSYLDVIREVFCEGPQEHLDLAPADVGLGPYDSWYQKSRTGVTPAVKEPVWSGAALAAWTGAMGVQEVRVEAGFLRLTTTTSDPALQSPALRVRASRYAQLVVEMRASQASDAQIFWTTSSQPATSEAASAHAPCPAAGEFQRVVFNFRGHEHWGGCLTGLRFAPTAAEGVRLEIRSIRLE